MGADVACLDRRTDGGIQVTLDMIASTGRRAIGLAADVTDHRDGTCSIKMGKLTELEETLALLLGGEGK